MDPITPIRFVEQFHLLFLAQLVRRVNPSLFVLKGGCNLRFFHHAVRYSDAMDLDLGEVGAQAFRDRVREMIGSRPFAQILEARGIGIDRVSEPKQTETTQRWKFALGIEGGAVPLPTKIECSRRGLDEGVVFGSVDPRVARAYRLPPLMASHYGATTALRQKIGALAARRETQARDVFDLHHLLASGAAGVAGSELKPDVVERACSNALAVGFSVFKSEVLAYLEPDDQARYDSAPVWDAIVLEVVDALQRGHR